MTTTMGLQDGGGVIRVTDSKGAVFSCPSVEFPTYEPEYQPLAAGILLRYWSERVQYINDGSQRGDPFYTYPRFAAFCARIAQYQAAYELAHPPDVVVYPSIFVQLDITGGDGQRVPAMYPKGTTALKSLIINGKLLSDKDDPASIIPVTYSWRIPIYQVVRERFECDINYIPNIRGSYPLLIKITAGIINIPTYTYDKLGVYMVDDDGFDVVDGTNFNQTGVKFKVKLIGGRKFFKVSE